MRIEQKVQYRKLGKSGPEVSVAGLGCGGYSRLGMAGGGSAENATDIVTRALDLGVNFFDTARAYGTEAVVGAAVKGSRDQVVISTKTMFVDRDGQYMPPERLVESLEKSLNRMQTDYVDVFSLHGVTIQHLDYCLQEFVPTLQKQVSLGKIRHLGITESFRQDPTHEMLKAAIPSGAFDVVMVGFNFLNPGARDEVFPLAARHGVATQVMHAVRRALADPSVLRETLSGLIERGELDPASVNLDDPLGFIVSEQGARTVTEAAYRFCAHEPGVTVVLTGTGNTHHLEDNVRAISGPKLANECLEKLALLFGGVRSVSGD